MSWKMFQIDHIAAIRVSCTGDLSADDMTQLAIETCFAVKQHDIQHVLLDISAATLTFPTAQLAALTDLYEDYRLPKTVRSAIVLGSKEWPENFSKVIAAAKEKGYSMDLLVGEAQVKAWLPETT